MGYYNKLDYVTDISKCYNAGVWNMGYNIFRFIFKNK